MYNLINRRNVGSDLSRDINSSKDFLLLLVTVYTVAAARENFNMIFVSSTPQSQLLSADVWTVTKQERQDLLGNSVPTSMSYMPRWLERLWSTTVCTVFWPFIAIQKAMAKRSLRRKSKDHFKIENVFFCLQLVLVVRKEFGEDLLEQMKRDLNTK